VNRESDDEIYAIYRENGLGVVIPLEHTMALVFPEGPHEAKEGQIDIVAMTPESAFWFWSAKGDCSL